MEHIGAGLAAIGVHRPGHRHRHPGWYGRRGDRAQPRRSRPDPRPRDHPRGFAEGLGVLAIVVGLLAIFIK